MCEYMEYDEQGNMRCKPCNDKCLLCVAGNSKRYNEKKEKEIVKKGGAE